MGALTDYLKDLYELAIEMYKFKYDTQGSLIIDYDGRGPLIYTLFNLIFLGGLETTTDNSFLRGEIHKYMQFLDNHIMVNNKFTSERENIRAYRAMEEEYKIFKQYTKIEFKRNHHTEKYLPKSSLYFEDISIRIDSQETVEHNPIMVTIESKSRTHTEQLKQERSSDGPNKRFRPCIIL